MRTKTIVFVWTLFFLFTCVACSDSTAGVGEPLTTERLLEEVNFYIDQNNVEEKYSPYQIEPLIIDDSGKIQTKDGQMDFTFSIETDDTGAVTEWFIKFCGENGNYGKSKMNTIYGYMFYSNAFITATAGKHGKEVREDFQKWAESTYQSGAIETESATFSYYNSGGKDFMTGSSSDKYILDTFCQIKR